MIRTEQHVKSFCFRTDWAIVRIIALEFCMWSMGNLWANDSFWFTFLQGKSLEQRHMLPNCSYALRDVLTCYITHSWLSDIRSFWKKWLIKPWLVMCFLLELDFLWKDNICVWIGLFFVVEIASSYFPLHFYTIFI